VWAPLALGIPHVAADVRYLLLPPYCRIALRPRDAVLVVALVALAVVSSPGLGAAMVLAAVVLTPGRGRGRIVALGMCAPLICAALAWPVATGYVVMHAHNAVALIVFAWVSRPGRGRWALPVAALGLAAAVLAGGFDALLPWTALDDLAGYVLPQAALAAWSPDACARIALTFVLLQGIHYAIWLRLIPATLRTRAGLRGFAASLRALERELSAPVVVAIAVAAVALPVLACIGVATPDRLRELYVQLAGGHAYLELAVLARWLAAWR
jgi:hypothetical protein